MISEQNQKKSRENVGHAGGRAVHMYAEPSSHPVKQIPTSGATPVQQTQVMFTGHTQH